MFRHFLIGRFGVLTSNACDHSFDDLVEQFTASEEALLRGHLPRGFDLVAAELVDEGLSRLHDWNSLAEVVNEDSHRLWGWASGAL